MMIKWRYKVTALYVSSGLKLRVCTKIIFSYFLTKAYVVGTQKEPSQWDDSFEHRKHMLKLMSKKIFTSLRWKII